MTTAARILEHSHFDVYTDGHFRCASCGEGYTFKSDYFAKQWANRHAMGIVYGTPRGLA